ncbi:hypothetical protein [Bradyrhizobium iriomotense]|uniref:hypothetical protein n=1 Tax=Bradyrhizobium iriomotense TaxID=441950 RepID=UPI001B8A2A8C|nr:hypothetical protein [Bradyrhizobium iriomotense]MBR0781422.1 hypothetical protein [Bradyrhizobium iriomotense]
MNVAGKPARARSAARPRAQDEMGWLLAVAAAFLVVHIVALTICDRATLDRTAPGQLALSQECD